MLGSGIRPKRKKIDANEAELSNFREKRMEDGAKDYLILYRS